MDIGPLHLGPLGAQLQLHPLCFFFTFSEFSGFENLSKYAWARVGVLARGSGYIHLGQKESQLVGDFRGWVVSSLLKSQGQEQQTSLAR